MYGVGFMLRVSLPASVFNETPSLNDCNVYGLMYMRAYMKLGANLTNPYPILTINYKEKKMPPDYGDTLAGKKKQYVTEALSQSDSKP